MSPANLKLVILLVISLCVGGVAGVGISHAVFPSPTCTARPTGAKEWQQFKNVPPLDDTGKAYR